MFTTEELGIISDALYEWEDNFDPKIEPKVIELQENYDLHC